MWINSGDKIMVNYTKDMSSHGNFCKLYDLKFLSKTNVLTLTRTLFQG